MSAVVLLAGFVAAPTSGVAPAPTPEQGMAPCLTLQRVVHIEKGRTIPSPGQLLRAVELLQCRFRLECLRLAGEGLCAKYANRRVGAREFRPFAAAVSDEAGCDVGRDAGVRPAIAAH